MEFIKLILVSFFSAITLFLIAKILGHKQVAQLDFFDYITGITIGSIAAEMATELESPARPLVAMLVYGIVSYSLMLLAHKFPKTRKYINGTPTIIMNNDKIFRKNMKRAKLELSEFMVLCRQAGYFNLADIETAVFEYNGHISIMPKSNKRPLEPDDVNLSMQKEGICTEFIMDGQILHENLKRLGLDLNWLKKELSSAGYKSADEIFLAVCDCNKKAQFYPLEE